MRKILGRVAMIVLSLGALVLIGGAARQTFCTDETPQFCTTTTSSSVPDTTTTDTITALPLPTITVPPVEIGTPLVVIAPPEFAG